MTLTEDQRIGLDIALNKAQLLGFEVDSSRSIAAATFKVFTLPEYGPVPDDRRKQLLFYPVRRVAARYLRHSALGAPWEVLGFGIDELLTIVLGLDHPSIHGWRFFDIHETSIRNSDLGRSLDWESGTDGRTHSITLSLLDRHWTLELTVWFDFLAVNSPTGLPIDLDSFIAGGKRWWDGLHGGDERTRGFGLVPSSAPGYGDMPCPSCGTLITIGRHTTLAHCAGCGAEFRR